MYHKLKVGDRVISPIDWEMTPELSFGTYESWGGRERVRDNGEQVYYFFVDNWGDEPKVCLMERAVKHAKVLAEIDVPGAIVKKCVRDQGSSSRFEKSYAVDDVVGQVAQSLGGHIDILMNNAGHLVKRSLIADMTDDHWFTTMNVNVTSTFFCTRAVLPFMNTGWGRIVNMSSLAARNGGGNGATAYAASKGAIIAFTRGLCKEVADQGITVNAVSPGLILETPFHDTFNTDEGIQGAINGTPLKRGGTPDDVAGAVLYFVSELGSFITGEIVEINGGLYFA